MKLKGEATLILRDVNTDEIISETTQSNIILESFYDRIFSSGRIAGCSIVVTSGIMESSRFTRWMTPTGGTMDYYTSFPNTFVPSNGNWNQYVPPTLSTDGIVQFSGRYNAPALGTSRTINSIGLTESGDTQSSFTVSNNDLLNYNRSFGALPITNFAFLKLTAPCTQTDTQVLDVFYRIYLPYDSANSEFSFGAWKNLLNNLIVAPPGLSNKGSLGVFKIPLVKSYDTGKTILTKRGFDYGLVANYREFTPTLNNQTSPTTTKGINYTDPLFTDNVGEVFTSLVWSNQGSWPTSYINFTNSNKIGNLIGQATWLTTPITASPFLDVDNLPTGTGKIYLGGSLVNSGTPSGTGLYYSYNLPFRNTIKITTTGAVGVSQYKLIKQNWLGYLPQITGQFGVVAYSRTTWQPLIALAASLPYGSPSTYSYDYNETIMGDIENKFDGQQLSASDRFDDSSFVIVKKDEILLYNIPAGDYWRYTAAYTNIHQIAVMNNKIYVACRNTGLWVIDPYNSLTVSGLASPGSGIDLSQCHGVAKGYGNTIWAVGVNCLASFNETTWTKYDQTSTPAFNMTGVSDSNWSNIEYLKVDEENVDNQMLLVRKFNATSDPTLLGVWWSTLGVASNTGAETQSSASQLGRPRLHRRHVMGKGGIWAILTANRYRVMSFGTSTFTNMAAPVGDDIATYPNIGYYNSHYLNTMDFVKNSAGQTRLLLHRPTNQGLSFGGITFFIFYDLYLLDASGSITDSVLQSSAGQYHTALLNETNDGWFRTTSSGAYSGNRDQVTNFILAPGVMLCAFVKESNSNYPGGSMFAVVNFGLDCTPNGGALAYLARLEYGWNGSQWVLGESNAKPTHADAQPLTDGVTVRFENGTGTSFVTPNVYSYTTSDGIFKDNATRATYASTLYYYRKVYKNQTDLQSSTVPPDTAQSTGIIGIDLTRSSANVSVNVDNEVIFSGSNTRQYAIGDKEVTGDFVISIDVTNINANNVKQTAAFGVTRVDYINSGNSNLMQFGFFWSRGILYWYDTNTWNSIVSPPSATTLEIRRTAGTLALYRNGSVVRTHDNSAIRVADYRLNTIFTMWDDRDPLYYNGGIRVPKATITTNGSDRAIYFGNPVTNTGSYNPRFYGVDSFTSGAITVTLNGTPATVRNNGTAPGPGEVTIDGQKGIMYFNAADEGKTVAANYLYQASE